MRRLVVGSLLAVAAMVSLPLAAAAEEASPPTTEGETVVEDVGEEVVPGGEGAEDDDSDKTGLWGLLGLLGLAGLAGLTGRKRTTTDSVSVRSGPPPTGATGTDPDKTY